MTYSDLRATKILSTVHFSEKRMAELAGQFAGVEVVLQQADTRAFADGKELGTGLLSVEESNLYWSSNSGSDSLALDYPNIAIHAVSRDTTVFPHQCVYLQYLRQSKEGEDQEEEEEEEVMEVRLVPPSTDHLDGIYQAITHCQTLYPDPEQSDSDIEDGEGEVEEEGDIDLESGDFFTTAEGFDHLSPQGLATLSHLERILQLPNIETDIPVPNGDGVHEPSSDQFEDADC